MKNLLKVLMVMAMSAGLLIALPTVGSAAGVESVKNEVAGSPPLRLHEWKQSEAAEKHAFVFGFVTMLELEKEWQGKKPMPISKSLIGSWAKGLNGVSARQMCEVVDAYVDAHPAEPDKQVVEVLWYHYVQPKLTPEMKKAASATYAKRKAK